MQCISQQAGVNMHFGLFLLQTLGILWSMNISAKERSYEFGIVLWSFGCDLIGSINLRHQSKVGIMSPDYDLNTSFEHKICVCEVLDLASIIPANLSTLGD